MQHKNKERKNRERKIYVGIPRKKIPIFLDLAPDR
jgi:hypothetical protein